MAKLKYLLNIKYIENIEQSLEISISNMYIR